MSDHEPQPQFGSPVPPPLPPPPPVSPLAPPAWPPSPPLGSPPLGSPPAGDNRRARRVGAAIAAIFVVVAAAFGFSALSGRGDGASSPDAAVRKFFDAIAAEDAIGVLESLAPEERDILRPTIEHLNDHLQRLGIISKVDLGHVPGVDLTVDGLEVSSTPVTDDISRVHLDAGTFGATTRPGAVPIGDVLETLIEANGGDTTVPDTSNSTHFGEGPDDFLAAEKVNGGWYVSLAFTIAEAARHDAGDPAIDPAQVVAADGADSPEDAVRTLLSAAGDLDVRRLIALLPPDEMRALQLYSQLFLGDAERAAADFKADNALSIDVSELELSTSDADGGKRVQISGGTLTADFGNSHLEVAEHDGCFTFRASGDLADVFSGSRTSTCDDQSSSSSSESNPFSELASRVGHADAGIITVQRGGKWYVSPTRTLADVLLGFIGAIDRPDLEQGGSLYKLFTGDFGELFGGTFDGSTDGSSDDSFSAASDFCEQLQSDPTPLPASDLSDFMSSICGG